MLQPAEGFCVKSAISGMHLESEHYDFDYGSSQQNHTDQSGDTVNFPGFRIFFFMDQIVNTGDGKQQADQQKYNG